MSEPNSTSADIVGLPSVRRSSLTDLLLPTLLIALAVRTLIFALGRASDHPWAIGDWLINYAGGMVRRGLSGEILLGLASLTGQSPALLASVLQLACFGVMLAGLYRLARPWPLNPPMVMLLGSPALILLYLHNPNGGLRKEVLLIALLTSFCARLAFDRRPVEIIERALLAAALMLLTLCHEMLFAYMPLFVIAMRLAARPPTTSLLNDSVILLPAALSTAVIVLFYRGDSATVAAICASLGVHAPSDCWGTDPLLGAVSFLAVDTRTAIEYTQRVVTLPIALSYAVATLLSMLPFVVIHRCSNLGDLLRARGPLGLSLGFAAITTQVLALCMVACDLGRFLHVLIFGMTLMTLLALHALGPALHFRRLHRPQLATVLTVLFVVGWKLKHVNLTPDRLLWWSRLLSDG